MGVNAEGATAAFGSEDGVELGEVALQGVLWLLELVIRSARVLWKWSRGQIGTRVDGGEKLSGRRNSPSNDSGAIPARWGLGSGAKDLGSSLGTRRCSCEDLPGWRHSGVA